MYICESLLRIRFLDPGFGAFLTPGSGTYSDPGSGMRKNPDTESGMNPPDLIFGLKIPVFKFFDAGPDPGSCKPWILDSRSCIQDPGSGINIPDPQHCIHIVNDILLKMNTQYCSRQVTNIEQVLFSKGNLDDSARKHKEAMIRGVIMSL
jgi:hypothetical protein